MADLRVLLGAELNTGDIFEADDLGGWSLFLSVAHAGFDDDIAELLFVHQSAERAHGQLKLLT